MQVPASIPVGSFKSSVFGIGPSGERLPLPSYGSSVFGSGRVEGATEARWIGELRRRQFPKEPVSSSSMTGDMALLGGHAHPPL